MRTLRLFALYLLMGVLSIGFYACSSDDKEPKVEPAEKVFLEIEKAGYTINAEAQELEVQIHTNIKVNMSTEYSEGDNGWINIGKVDATGEYLTYHLDIKENTKSSTIPTIAIILAIVILPELCLFAILLFFHLLSVT